MFVFPERTVVAEATGMVVIVSDVLSQRGVVRKVKK